MTDTIIEIRIPHYIRVDSGISKLRDILECSDNSRIKNTPVELFELDAAGNKTIAYQVYWAADSMRIPSPPDGSYHLAREFIIRAVNGRKPLPEMRDRIETELSSLEAELVGDQ